MTAAKFCGVAFTDMRKLVSSRSSSPCRDNVDVCGATPIARNVIRYWPPPSGKRIVYLPSVPVVRLRETRVSSDVAVTVAPAKGGWSCQ